MITKSVAIISTLIILFSPSISSALDLPEEAYQAARDFLHDTIIKSLESKGTNSTFFADFRDFSIADIKNAEVKYPFAEYTLSYKDVLKSKDDPEDLLSRAKLVHYCFQLFINGKWWGVIEVREVGDGWDGVGYSKACSYIYEIIKKYGYKGNSYASIFFNSGYVFTILRINGRYYFYVDDSNKSSIHLFSGNVGMFGFKYGIKYLKNYSEKFSKLNKSEAIQLH